MMELKAGKAICTLLAEKGGALTGWTIGDQPMLRNASLEAIADFDPLGMASFPLVPYSNRIADATFVWAGRPYYLARNLAPENHAIHGVGWKLPWEISNCDANYAKLTLNFSGNEGWPWAFVASQEISLTEHQLVLKLSVKNMCDIPVPLAFGHHPYFDQTGAQLEFSAQSVWMSDANALPTTSAKPIGQFDFSESALVEGRNIDNCYAGWDGKAKIRWHGRPYALQITGSSELPAAVVYIPQNGDAFCFEPVPHINNAINMTTASPAMPTIAPGEQFSAQITMMAIAV
jgi:aldose 1-epimerase